MDTSTSIISVFPVKWIIAWLFFVLIAAQCIGMLLTNCAVDIDNGTIYTVQRFNCDTKAQDYVDEYNNCYHKLNIYQLENAYNKNTILCPVWPPNNTQR